MVACAGHACKKSISTTDLLPLPSPKAKQQQGGRIGVERDRGRQEQTGIMKTEIPPART